MIKNAQIKRLSQMGGAKTINRDIYYEVRTITSNFLAQMIQKAAISTENNNRRTIMQQDIVYAYQDITNTRLDIIKPIEISDIPANIMQKVARNMLSDEEKIRWGPVLIRSRNYQCPIFINSSTGNRGDLSDRQIKHYQSQIDCLHIPKLTFQKLVREITQDLNIDLKWSKNALIELHILTEKYIVQLFEKASEIAFHAKRMTIYPKDIIISRNLCGGYHIR